jgi:trans-2-enoyl-CoA reductase
MFISSHNPFYIQMHNVQGTYPLKPPLPGVGGGEGVAEVLAVRECPALRPGDWVLPSLSMSGTWRSHAVLDQTSVISIRSHVSTAFV